jgi:hypothetical protein
MSDQHRASVNTFVFADALNVTVNAASVTVLGPGGPEDEEVYAHNLRSIYVLLLENEGNAFLVYEAVSGDYVHYELEDTPIEGPFFDRFLGFLTRRMPYISSIKQPYMQKLGLRRSVMLQKGWRLSFDQHDYLIAPAGPTRNHFTPGCSPYSV